MSTYFYLLRTYLYLPAFYAKLRVYHKDHIFVFFFIIKQTLTSLLSQVNMHNRRETLEVAVAEAATAASSSDKKEFLQYSYYQHHHHFHPPVPVPVSSFLL